MGEIVKHRMVHQTTANLEMIKLAAMNNTQILARCGLYFTPKFWDASDLTMFPACQNCFPKLTVAA